MADSIPERLISAEEIERVMAQIDADWTMLFSTQKQNAGREAMNELRNRLGISEPEVLAQMPLRTERRTDGELHD